MIVLAVDHLHNKLSKAEWASEEKKRMQFAGEEAKARAEASAALDIDG
jgi:hypothetical protein